MSIYNEINQAVKEEDFYQLRALASRIAEFDESLAHKARLEANRLENEAWAFDRATDEALIG